MDYFRIQHYQGFETGRGSSEEKTYLTAGCKQPTCSTKALFRRPCCIGGYTICSGEEANLNTKHPERGNPFIIDGETIFYTVILDRRCNTYTMHFTDSRHIQIHASKPISLKRARSILAREKDWIREQMHLLQDGGWKGGTFPVVGCEVPYTVIVNPRRKHPCLIIKKYERIEIETPGPMTRRACEAFLNENQDWISGIFQKNDRSGSFNSGSVRIDGEDIPYYTVVNRRRKRIAIAIRDDLGIEVRSPTPLSKETAKAAIVEHEDWIRRARRKKAALAEEMPPRQYLDGDTIPFQGRLLTIRHYESDDGIRAAITKGELHINIPPGTIPEQSTNAIRSAVMDCYYHEILPIAEEIGRCSAEAIGVSPPVVRFGYQKSRFGSCTPKNGIIINLRIAQAPPELLEYTIVHEVCHLVEKNHQKPFWDLVGSVLPGYAAVHRQLQKEGMQYFF